MKKLAIIGAQRMAKNFAINAREMGVETHCFAWPKGAIAKDFVDFFYPISIFEIDEIVRVCNEIDVDGIVSTTELTIPIVAQIAERLGLNGIPVEVSKVITDKYRNREASKFAEGLSHPNFAKVASLEELLQLDLKFPIILKPTAEGGKRGITVVNCADEFESAFAYATSESKKDELLIVEEYIRGGKEFSVESLSYHGKHKVIQVTEKISSGPPHCVELGHIQPARISSEDRDMIENAVVNGLVAIGYTNGPSHTEVKLVDDKVYLIEFNTRPGGDFISYPLCDLSTGYSYLKGAIQIALDEFEFPTILKKKYSGVCFVTEQTRQLVDLFKICETKPWCYRKNDVGCISALLHNGCDNTNYFIWNSEDGVPSEVIQNF